MKLLEVENLTKRFGGLVAVNNVNFYINQGEIFGLIGPNGSGKTVLFNTISGIYKNDGGGVAFNGERITNLPPHVITKKGLGRTFQEVRTFPNKTVLQNVMVGRHCRTSSHLGSAIFWTSRARRDDRETEEKAMHILELIGGQPGLAEVKDVLARELNYVRTRLVGFGIALATDPILLLLDEPVAGMNSTEIRSAMELIKRIRDTGVTIFLIEHRLKTITEICDRVMALDYGVKIAEGTPQEVMQNKDVVEAYLGRGYSEEREVTTLVKEIRADEVATKKGGKADGKQLKVNNIQTYYGSLHVLKGASLEVADEELVAVIGANASGKTTLLMTISGFVTPAQGDIEYDGKRIDGMKADKIAKMGIIQVPQTGLLFSIMTVKENLEMGAYLRKDKKTIARDLEAMYELFPILKERSKQQAGTLSGGEQQMVAIARGLMANPKLLLMDEPSAGLSPLLVETVAKTITEIRSRKKISILLIEQNANMALRIADRAYVLRLGELVLTGTGEELLHNDEVRKAYLDM